MALSGVDFRPLLCGVKAIIFHTFTLSSLMKKMTKWKVAKKVLFSSRLIIQILLFAIFCLLFALPAIKTYQKREVGWFNYIMSFFSTLADYPTQLKTLAHKFNHCSNLRQTHTNVILSKQIYNFVEIFHDLRIFSQFCCFCHFFCFHNE